MDTVCARVAPLGWHLQLFGAADLWPQFQHRLRKLPVQLVFDHYGNVPAGAGVLHPAFATISSLVSQGRAWVKLSAPMNVSQSGAPDYSDVEALARAYLSVDASRMVWDSDWPHPAMALALMTCKPWTTSYAGVIAIQDCWKTSSH